MSQIEMMPTDLKTAVCRLLCCRELRTAYESSPEQVARQLNVDDHYRREFSSLDPRQLNLHAESLFNKRWHEIRRLVPRTIETLGSEAAEIFRFFATNDWPVDHRRHPVDAFRFLNFLQANQLGTPCAIELKRLQRMAV